MCGFCSVLKQNSSVEGGENLRPRGERARGPGGQELIIKVFSNQRVIHQGTFKCLSACASYTLLQFQDSAPLSGYPNSPVNVPTSELSTAIDVYLVDAHQPLSEQGRKKIQGPDPSSGFHFTSTCRLLDCVSLECQSNKVQSSSKNKAVCI